MMRRLLNWLSPGAGQGRLSVLIFHRVLAAPDHLFPGVPDAARFEAQLCWVARWFNVLALDEAIRLLYLGRLPERALAISFDDGYADNYSVALPILKRLALPATVFVASGFLDGGRMWNDTVIESVRRCPHDALDLRGLDLGSHSLGDAGERRAAIDALLRALKYLPQAERDQRAAEIARRSGADLPSDLMLSSTQLRKLVREGVTIGAHTVSHPILARLDAAAARQEIAAGRAALEQLTGAPVQLFAYPNGKPGNDYTDVHVRMVKELGFAAAVSTARGTAGPETDPFQLPRFTPWDRTALRYGLRLARNLTLREAA